MKLDTVTYIGSSSLASEVVMRKFEDGTGLLRTPGILGMIKNNELLKK